MLFVDDDFVICVSENISTKKSSACSMVHSCEIYIIYEYISISCTHLNMMSQKSHFFHSSQSRTS